MKKIVEYECEFCHTRYQKKEMAQKCEKKHYEPKSTKNQIYEVGNSYPSSIQVSLVNNDGKEVCITYYRKKKH